MKGIIEAIKETVLCELQSEISTDEEIESMSMPYDDDHSYAYGERAGLEHAIEIIEDIFNDFGY